MSETLSPFSAPAADAAWVATAQRCSLFVAVVVGSLSSVWRALGQVGCHAGRLGLRADRGFGCRMRRCSRQDASRFSGRTLPRTALRGLATGAVPPQCGGRGSCWRHCRAQRVGAS
jgi:hypothetical protein